MLTQGEHEMVVEYFDGSNHNTLEVLIEGEGLGKQSIGNLLFTPKAEDVVETNDFVGINAATAAATWSGYLPTWVRPFGDAEVAITDGGPEFQEKFEEGMKKRGTSQHVTNARTP